MSRWVQRLDKIFYPDVENNWDDILFRAIILEGLSSNSVILDLGAGVGIVAQMNFQGHVATVCGVDIDSRVVENPFLDEGKVGEGENIPYGNNTFDVVFSDNVLEHLDEPGAVFVEISRVLKPGGKFFFKTPNSKHYMPLIARLTPHRFHEFINRIRGRAEVDIFPTRYRANSRCAIVKLAAVAGMIVENLQLIEGRPEYMRLTAPLYLVAIAYERIVNSSELFSEFRILLVGTIRKPF